MKHHRIVGARLLATLCVALLFSCTSGVYLDEIDKTGAIDASVALPIGRISFPLKAFLSHMQINDDTSIEPNMDEAARLELKYHGKFLRPFTYLGEEFEQSICASNVLPSVPVGLIAINDGKTQYDKSFTISIPILFDDINSRSFIESVGRIDSILVDNADFELTMSFQGGLASQTDKITSIVVSSGDLFLSRPIEFTTYEQSLHFGTPMQKNIRTFSINLMKDRHLLDKAGKQPSLSECIENVNQGITLDLTLYSGNTPLTVSADDAVSVSLSMKTLSYAAIWGWFNINNQQQDSQTLKLDSILPSGEDLIGWRDIKALRLPLAEPSVSLTIGTEVAGPLNLDIAGINVTALNEDGSVQSVHNASFLNPDGTRSENYMWPIITDPMLQNYKTEPYNTVYSNTITFDENQGRLDELFQARPDEISYTFEVVLNEESDYYLQQRVTKKDGVDLDVNVVLPFVFNKGVDLQTPDFTFDLSIPALEVEELDLEIDLEDLSLILDLENTIPLGLQLVYAFLDEDGNKIEFRNLTGSGEPTEDTDTIAIPAAVDVDANGLPNLNNPAKVTRRIRFDQSELDRLANVEKMQIAAIIQTDDASFNRTDRVVITQEEGLAVTLKASAALRAVIDLNQHVE